VFVAFVEQGKKAEEEFSTGPLTMLMMSIKINTQVGGFPPLRLLVQFTRENMIVILDFSLSIIQDVCLLVILLWKKCLFSIGYM
jgi:hypothetical protein